MNRRFETKKVAPWIFVIALVVGYGQIEPQSAIAAPNVDIWTAAAQGNLEAIKQHVSAGTDLNAKEPGGGSTPLIMAALSAKPRPPGCLSKTEPMQMPGTTMDTPLCTCQPFSVTPRL